MSECLNSSEKLSEIFQDTIQLFAPLKKKINDVTDSRKFLSTVKPFFCDTSKTVRNIILSDNDKMSKDEKKVAKTLNDYFTNLTKKLK